MSKKKRKIERLEAELRVANMALDRAEAGRLEWRASALFEKDRSDRRAQRIFDLEHELAKARHGR